MSLYVEYENDRDDAKEAIQRLVSYWGIDGLVLIKAVEKWIEEAEPNGFSD